jgi:tetratricopeptide (TPR) repeat protein
MVHLLPVKRRFRKQSVILALAALLLASAPVSRGQSFQVLAPIRLTLSSCQQARGLTQSGINMSEAQHFSRAITQFEAALSLCPEDENTALDLIQTTVNVRDFAKAESEARGLLAHHSRSEPAQVLLAYSYLMQRKFRYAGQTLQRLLARDGKNPDALELMGLTLFFYREYVMAETELRAALAIRPDDQNDLYALARVYQTQNSFPAASHCFRQLIAHDPSYYRAYDNLALCYEAEGKTREADAMFTKAEQVASRVDPSYDWPYADHAEMLFKQGQTGEALLDIEKAVRISPRSARNQYILGEVLLAKNDLSGAQKHLRTSIHLDAGMAKAHYLLARTYEMSHEPAKAREEFARFELLSEKHHAPARFPALKALPGRRAIGQ